MKNRYQNLLFFAATLALIGVIMAAPRVSGLITEGSLRPASIKPPEPLPVVGTYEKFKELVDKGKLAAQYGWLDAPAGISPGRGFGEKSAGLRDDFAYTGHSETNVQVAGVDEADLVKTDGEYIYQIDEQTITITKARPAASMKVMSTIKPPLGLQEIYVHDNYLVAIGTYHYQRLRPEGSAPLAPDSPESAKTSAEGTVKAIVYDIADKADPKQVKELSVEGDYLSSRKVGPVVYTVANYSVDVWDMERNPAERGAFIPSYHDSAVSPNEFKQVDLDQVRYFPESPQPNYLMLTAIDLDRLDEPATIKSWLGGGQQIYASAENLYVAAVQYNAESLTLLKDEKRPAGPPILNTVIYKFGLDGADITYKAKGLVPGQALNQFSMDEHKDNFRIATSRSDDTSTPSNLTNNLYVLDPNLQPLSKIEGIAPGETIYAARFMGDRAYLVTYEPRRGDPFFVIDLKDPAAPKILGELKIPGYSEYLHPYDEDTIIGFGREIKTVTGTDGDRGDFTAQIDQGMKMALFDVSDVRRPIERSKIVLDGNGTYSPLLNDHKALLFSKERGLLAFPIGVREMRAVGQQQSPWPSNGDFVFQGLYVYKISAKGLTLRGKITHLNEAALEKARTGWLNWGKMDIFRALYIGDTLYTVSGSTIKAHTLSDLKEIGSVRTLN